MFGLNKRHYDRGHRQGWFDANKEAAIERKRLVEVELSLMINKPVIVVGNEWNDPIIGFGLSIEHVSKARTPMLVVRDYLNGDDVLTFGVIRPFTNQLYRAIKKLDPFERWVLISRMQTNFEDFNKPKIGIASTPEELDRKLAASGFFVKLKEFRSLNCFQSDNQ